MDFNQRLRNAKRPVVVDFWTPWCMPCRAVSPVVEKLGKDYAGKVDVWKVNADDEPETLRALRIYGIPTLIAFKDGEEIDRRTGAAPESALVPLFESALTGVKVTNKGPALSDRLIRLGVGLALIGLAFFAKVSAYQIVLVALGGVIMFTGVYDRCPIYRAVSGYIKGLFNKD